MEPDNEAEAGQEDTDTYAPDDGKPFRRMAATLLRCLKLVVSAAPQEAAGVTLLHLLQGLGPALSLYLTKVVIDAVTRFNPATSSVRSAVYACAAALVGYVVVEIVMDTVETLGGFLNTTLHEKVDRQVHHALLAKISGFHDLSLFENPRLLNLVHLAQSGTNHLTTLLLNINNLMLAVFSFVPVFLLGFAIAWWIPFLIFLTALPSIYVQERLEQNLWSLEEAQAETMRAKAIHEGFLADAQFAKEVRLFSLQPLFLARWDRLYGDALQQTLALRKRGAVAILAWSLLSGVGVAAAYIYVVVGTFRQQHTVGDLAVFTGLIFQVRHVWYVLLGNGLGLFTVCREIRPIFDLLELSPTIVSGTMSADAPDTKLVREQNAQEGQSNPNAQGGRGAWIEFNDVSFRYADTAPDVLHGVSLRIEAGETIAIVGENGAGKTTLAKLACRLYDPTEGQILWDGSDLRSLNLDSLRARIAVVPQDFARFSATLRDNIAFGWLPVREQDEALRQVVHDVGLHSLLERDAAKGGVRAADTKENDDSNTGLDRLIGAQLEGGTNLSGGQWQRVAIARAVVRKGQARLMLLDEPTASLDPRTEYEALKLLQTLAEECTTIIITHRLSLARACDRIVVLERGQIVEVGTHAELRARGGLYNEMFLRQASSYMDGADNTTAAATSSAASEIFPVAGAPSA